MQHVAIYMNPNGACTIASCWGDPEGFLNDLGKSDFIHVVDQYTGSTADDRYTVANTHVMINSPRESRTVHRCHDASCRACGCGSSGNAERL